MKTEDIKKLAELARIRIREKEASEFAAEIEDILKYVADVQKVAKTAKEEKPFGKVKNVLRVDGLPHETGLYTEALLKAMPRTEGGYLKVKKIL